MKQIFTVFTFVFVLFSCDPDHKSKHVDPLDYPLNYIPKKPYIIIDKMTKKGETEFVIVYVDANGKRLSFETSFTNESSYNVGDTIK